MDATTAPDAYRVRVWSRRRNVLGPFMFGQWGWTVDIDYLGEWDESGDQSLLCSRELWFLTQAAAIEFGVYTATDIHEHDCPSVYGIDDPGPLVIYVGPDTVIDRRVQA